VSARVATMSNDLNNPVWLVLVGPRARSATFRPVTTVEETRHADDSVMILEERRFDADANNQCRRASNA